MQTLFWVCLVKQKKLYKTQNIYETVIQNTFQSVNSFTTKKPVLFVNTPMKIMNPEYEKIDIAKNYIIPKICKEYNLDKIYFALCIYFK